MPGGLENRRESESGRGSEKEAVRADKRRTRWVLSRREMEPGIGDGIVCERLVVLGGGVVETEEEEPRAVGVVGVSEGGEGGAGDNRTP